MDFEVDQELHEAWQELKERCCQDPKKAKRVVMLSESDFKAALKPRFRLLMGVGEDGFGFN